MNRQKILVAACVLASVSIGGNIWLLTRKKEPAPAAQQKTEGPKMPEFDFKGTAFEDGAWKLGDDAEKKGPVVGPSGKKAVPGEEPVFGGTALEDGAWKLGDDKDQQKKTDADKDKASVGGSDKSVSPPDSAEPKIKAAAARPLIERFDFSDTAFADNSWKLSDTAEETEADVFSLTDPDRLFVFGEFQVPRDPATMEEKVSERKIIPFGPDFGLEDPKRCLKGSLNGQGVRIYVSRDIFERSLPPGPPINLRGFEAREAGLHLLQ